MNDHDLAEFMQTFQQLRTVFPLRADAVEVQQIQGLYFRVLQRYPIAAVVAAAARWIEHGKRFPKPAEWVRTIPKATAAKLPPLVGDEAEEHVRAAGLGYQDDPCCCVACKAAGVDHRFLRYVPDADADDRDVHALAGGKVVARGHWAHGEELAAWYRAHDAFMGLQDAYPARPMPKLPPAEERVETFAKLLIAQVAARVAELEAHPPAELVEEHTT